MVSRVLQLKITLKGAKPPIWRRVLVSGATTLDEFHQVIQDTMGWLECHLHAFDLPDGSRCSNLQFGLEEYGERIRDESKVKIQSALKHPQDTLLYEYDFGDGWEHKVTLEKVLKPAEVKQELPYCSAGRRACPPEDAGGVWGYEHKLEVLAGADSEERRELAEWFPPNFDPAKFDRNETNEVLRQGWDGQETPLSAEKPATPQFRILLGGRVTRLR